MPMIEHSNPARQKPSHLKFGSAALFEGPNHAEVQSALLKHIQNQGTTLPGLNNTGFLAAVTPANMVSISNSDYFVRLTKTPEGKSCLVYMDGSDWENYQHERDAFVETKLQEFDTEAAKNRKTRVVSDDPFDMSFQQLHDSIEAMNRSFARSHAEEDFHQSENGALSRLKRLTHENKGLSSTSGATKVSLFNNPAVQPANPASIEVKTPKSIAAQEPITEAPTKAVEIEKNKKYSAEKPTAGFFSRIFNWFRNLWNRLFG